MQYNLSVQALTEQSFNERRRSVRVAVPANLRGVELGRHRVEITDISEGGCLLVSPHQLPVGLRVVLKMGTFDSMPGVVSWTNFDATGVQFTTPLHPGVVDFIAGSFSN